MWKAYSFTTNEIVFFFFLLDYLSERNEPVSLKEIYTHYDNMHKSGGFQQSSAQWWLKNKGIPSGVIVRDDKHKYSLAPIYDLSTSRDLLFYYSEIAPIGVVGSFVMDKLEVCRSPFVFKQHYIGQAFDSEVLCNILCAIKNNRVLKLEYFPKNKTKISVKVFPLKVYSSTKNGRQYLIAWDGDEEGNNFLNYRLDRIKGISITELTAVNVIGIHDKFNAIKEHIWGVSLGDGKIDHVEILLKVSKNEG